MNPGNVSAIIQGPINHDKTRQAIASVRRFLPGAEIVVSTWPGQDLDGIDCDNLVINVDPGALQANNSTEQPIFNNLNRQIVSTINGLRASTRLYAIKLRSDCVLTSPVDFSAIDKRPRFEGYAAFEKPIVILNVYTRNPLKRPLLFHYSDIYMFGLRSDLLSYWSAPLSAEPLFTRWLEKRNRPIVCPFPEKSFQFRCAPEQYLGQNAAKIVFPMRDLDHMADGSVGLLIKSIRFLANNFLVLSPQAAGIALPERMASHQSHYDLYHESDEADMDFFRKRRLPAGVFLRCTLQYWMACYRDSLFNYSYAKWKGFVINRLKGIFGFIA